MSGYAYKCPGCGGGFTDTPDPVMCCGAMRQPYPCGRPPAEAGPPMIISDEIHGERFDTAAGRCFDSKSERREYYKAHGLVRTSVREAQDTGLMRDHPKVNRTYSYSGQTDRDTTRRWADRVH